jgi:hypothetical protein
MDGHFLFFGHRATHYFRFDDRWLRFYLLSPAKETAEAAGSCFEQLITVNMWKGIQITRFCIWKPARSGVTLTAHT